MVFIYLFTCGEHKDKFTSRMSLISGRDVPGCHGTRVPDA